LIAAMKFLLCPYTEGMAGRPPTKAPPPFGAKLAELRKLRGMTQPQLAEALSVSLDMLNYYERRALNPSAEFLKKTAGFFGVSVDELLGHSTPSRRKSGPPSQLEQRLSAIRQLPREKQKLVLQVLDTFLRDAQHAKAA
jgi:transcriptional regulator with XRE-family HTH domain